jgi:hypothetical protein
MTTPSPKPFEGWSPDREALLRTTMALTIEQRIEWLEQMMRIGLATGALPKQPDQARPRP